MNKIVKMQQIHGNNVLFVTSAQTGLTVPNCDGLVTTDPEIILSLKTADCLPISITHVDKKIIGLVHAGWRGLQKGIIKNAIELILSKDIDPNDLKVLIGPHICKKHYEVKDDVASLFREITTFNGKKKLDLAQAAINQFVDMGININKIQVDPKCTFEDLSLPSYRRNKTEKRLVTTLNI